MVGEEEEEEEGETERWADRSSPRGEPGEAGRQPREAERRRRGAGHGIRGEGPASHRPMGEEEEGAGSLKGSTRVRRWDSWTAFFYLQYRNKYFVKVHCSEITNIIFPTVYKRLYMILMTDELVDLVQNYLSPACT